ncbi:uncharacterized protein LOC130628783 [Hydractinia symbiolongicarpus]|uniref:uncharacterized protein LOC130628783 n=1 Tax=Hydractinia symbiolongicarpus TaxID=13093 RepID=UPI002550BFEF|nr:uncharacterized protein LOC130628783 [Hydractinia symbiolongicarpus]
MSNSIAAVIYFTLSCMSMLLHVVAFTLLWKKHANITRNQKIILLNLCMVEVLISCSDLPRAIIYETVGSETLAYKSFVTLFYCFILAYLYFMIALTMDRLAQIYLNIKYDLYWPVRRTKYLTGIIWTLTLLLGFVMLLILNLKKDNSKSKNVYKVVGDWILPVAFFLFLFIVIFTYTYIAKKIIQTKRVDARVSFRCSMSHHSCDCSLEYRRKIQEKVRLNDVLLPTLLIVTYVVFVMFPILVSYLMKRNILPESSWLHQKMNPMFYLGCFSDAIICILLSTTFGRRVISGRSQRRRRRRDSHLNKSRISAK